MISPARLFLCLLVLLTNHDHSNILLVQATLDGDEQYGDILGGRFWAFTSLGVSIVDPETCQIEHVIHHDQNGDRLPPDWRDGAYIQTDRNNNGLFEGMVLVAAGRPNSDGEVVVFDTISSSKTPVIARVPVGGDPMYSYAVFPHHQFWTHSQEDGKFYVIDLLKNDFLEGKTDIRAVKAALQSTSHQGQLFFHTDTHNHEDDGNKNIGYATSEGEAFLFIIHMEERTQIGTYPFPNGTCTGAASMAYSHVNRHLFVECHGSGGILEFDVSNGELPNFVQQHPHIGGRLLETPDQVYVTATDPFASVVHFFTPSKVTGTASIDTLSLKVPDNPSYPSFFYEGTTYDYIACMPTMNQLDPTMPCGYWDTCPSIDTCPLLQDGLPKNPNDELYYKSGVRCIDVKDALLGIKKEAPLIRFAGGVKHIPKTANPCTFEKPSRPHKRGAHKYDASLATLPINALHIVDMYKMSHKCFVPLQGTPKTVVYVPSAFHHGSPAFLAAMNSEEGLAVELLVLIIIMSVGLTIFLLVCSLHWVKRKQSGVEVITEKDIQQDLEDAGIEMPSAANSEGDSAALANEPGAPRVESGELT